MSTPSNALASLIELAQSLLLDCHALATQDWESALAERCQAELERLADYAANLDMDPMHAAALDLYAYLGVFAEGILQPNAHQKDELLSLCQTLQASLLSVAPELGAEQEPVYALLPATPVPDELAQRLAQAGFLLATLAEGDELAERLRLQLPRVLLVEAGLVSAVCELLDGLSEQRPEAAQIPIVAIGPPDQPRHRLKALIEGADLYLDDLRDADLARQLRSLLVDEAAEVFRVLVVDDDRQMSRYCDRILRRAGMQVQCVQSSDQVHAAVRSFNPELILMDLYMPGQDGMSVTTELRQQSDSLVLPIVFLSGEQSEEARVQAIAAGGDDFLTKPVRPRHLVAAVRSRIKRARAIGRQIGTAVPSKPRGLIRKSEFLPALEHPSGAPEPPVLLALGLDQADSLDQRLGLAAKYELEQAVAQRLLQVLRASDRLCLWREFGFGVLLEQTRRSDILATAEELRRAIADQNFKLHNQDTRLSLSIGMAVRPRQADLEVWINASFAALAAAQRLGGNRVEGLLAEDDGEMAPERLLWIRELVRATAGGSGLVTEFQPLLSLRGQRSGSYALLLSLRDKRRPLEGIPRREYVAVAREMGALANIERLALFRALEALDDQRSRRRIADVLVALDLNSLDRDQLAWIERELARRDYHGQVLSVAFDAELLLGRPALIGLVKRLRQIGVRVLASERSGPGRLLALQALPLDGVRLPVDSVLTADPAAMAGIIEEWHAQDRSITLEAVDDMTQLCQLWNLGVDYLQGAAVAAAGPRLDYDFGESTE
jgi:DNA-binding response OmpR family regulator/GGDEF domain-containing protein